ncbi:MAG TPA: hypothetical protein VMV50_01200 [Candidatus Paceibacterota bacterium]|nr:hypothetical protein [Candidatus Paceibacterota bacterium]
MDKKQKIEYLEKFETLTSEWACKKRLSEIENEFEEIQRDVEDEPKEMPE